VKSLSSNVKYQMKKTMKEIKDYPPGEWRKVDHFERLVNDLNKSLKVLQIQGFELAKEVSPFNFAADHYSSTGKTINDRGFNSLLFHIENLEEVLLNLNNNKVQSSLHQSNSQSPQSVFIVHGRDELALSQTENIVRRLGLEPIVLRRKANQGLTLIEKFEKHSNVKFAIVLLTPDDVGALSENGPTPHLQFRARQNVIFELGFFYGKLGRAQVCCLLKGGVEKPSDIDGISYIGYSNFVEERELDIMKELKAAGIETNIYV
jgi:predicted nucleotide-binding protein